MPASAEPELPSTTDEIFRVSTARAPAPILRSTRDGSAPAGPSQWSRLRGLRIFRVNSADFLIANARQYGDLVHFGAAGRHIFQFNHPELVSEMLLRDAPHHHRGIVMQRARFVLGDGLLTSEEPLHMRQRRLSQPAFHRDRIAAYGEVIGNYASKVSGRWRDGVVTDLHPEMLLLALQIVGKCLFNAEVESEVERIAAAVDAFMGFLPLAFLPFSDTLLRLPLPIVKRIRHGQMELDALIYRMIRERRAQPGDRGDLLSMLLAAVDTEEDTGGMTDRQLRDECLTVLLAGHETTANALCFSLWLLGQHPAAQEQLAAEAQAVLGDRTATAADYARLPYAQMVFAESMRLYPPVWTTARTAAESYVYRGYTIPKGSLLLAPQIAIHRDERFYAEPGEFRPERFATEEKAARPRFAYFPFGAGARQCIGEGLAWMEGALTLATVARTWRLLPAPGSTATLHVLPRITLRPRDGLPLLLQRR